VHIAPIWSETGGPLVQDGFDSPANFYYHYVPVNLDNNQSTWRQTSSAGYSNNTSVFLNAIDMDVTSIDEGGNDIDELVTPSMDLSNVEDASVTFKYAYATQSTDLEGITDEFEVYISSNCGQTWSATPRVSLAGFELVTAGSVAIPFVPNSASDWREESFDVPSTYLNSGFRMKFVFKAGEYPNNLYIDDINMSGVVSVNEQDADFYGATIYPNPANEVAVLSYTNRNASKLEINLTDVSGRVIQSWNAGMGNPGKQQLTIDTSSLANGAYFVNISSASHTRSLKLMVD
jgi:hypothetical protein